MKAVPFLPSSWKKKDSKTSPLPRNSFDLATSSSDTFGTQSLDRASTVKYAKSVSPRARSGSSTLSGYSNPTRGHSEQEAQKGPLRAPHTAPLVYTKDAYVPRSGGIVPTPPAQHIYDPFAAHPPGRAYRTAPLYSTESYFEDDFESSSSPELQVRSSSIKGADTNIHKASASGASQAPITETTTPVTPVVDGGHVAQRSTTAHRLKTEHSMPELSAWKSRLEDVQEELAPGSARRYYAPKAQRRPSAGDRAQAQSAPIQRSAGTTPLGQSSEYSAHGLPKRDVVALEMSVQDRRAHRNKPSIEATPEEPPHSHLRTGSRTAVDPLSRNSSSWIDLDEPTFPLSLFPVPPTLKIDVDQSKTHLSSPIEDSPTLPTPETSPLRTPNTPRSAGHQFKDTEGYFKKSISDPRLHPLPTPSHTPANPSFSVPPHPPLRYTASTSNLRSERPHTSSGYKAHRATASEFPAKPSHTNSKSLNVRMKSVSTADMLTLKSPLSGTAMRETMARITAESNCSKVEWGYAV